MGSHKKKNRVAANQLCSPVLLFFGLLCALSCENVAGPHTKVAEPRIIFRSDRLDTKYDIFSMSLDGTRTYRLTGDSTVDTCPSALPGGRIAYVTGGLTGGSRLVVMNGDGSDKKNIAVMNTANGAFSCVSWSSSGELFAYYDQAKFHVVRQNGADVAAFFPGTSGSSAGAIKIAPDDSRVLLGESSNDAVPGFTVQRLSTALLDGTKRSQYLNGWQASWNKAGDRILLTCIMDVFNSYSSSRICTVSSAVTDLRVLGPAGAHSPLFSPDESMIAYQSADLVIGVMDPSGANIRTFAGAKGAPVAWTPDGKSVVFECGVTEPGRFQYDICSVSISDGSISNLTRNPGDDHAPVIGTS